MGKKGDKSVKQDIYFRIELLLNKWSIVKGYVVQLAHFFPGGQRSICLLRYVTLFPTEKNRRVSRLSSMNFRKARKSVQAIPSSNIYITKSGETKLHISETESTDLCRGQKSDRHFLRIAWQANSTFHFPLKVEKKKKETLVFTISRQLRLGLTAAE